MSRRRNVRVDSSPVTQTTAAFGRPYEFRGTISESGWVTTPYGFVQATSDAVNDLCVYRIIAGGRSYLFREDGTRTKRGLVRRSKEFAWDAQIRAGIAQRTL